MHHIGRLNLALKKNREILNFTSYNELDFLLLPLYVHSGEDESQIEPLVSEASKRVPTEKNGNSAPTLSQNAVFPYIKLSFYYIAASSNMSRCLQSGYKATPRQCPSRHEMLLCKLQMIVKNVLIPLGRKNMYLEI